MPTLQKTARKKAKTYDGPSPEEILVADLITLMQEGKTPWRKPWVPMHGGHRNLVTGALYGGQNPILLELGSMMRGHHLPLWIGASQARQFGWFPKKGSKSVRIVRPQSNSYEKVDGDGKPVLDPDGNPEMKSWVSYKLVPIFNVNDLKPKDYNAQVALEERISTWISPNAAEEPARLELAEQKLEAWEVKRQDGTCACYSPAHDTIATPPAVNFENREAFCSTWAHECIHSTGHESRLDRKLGVHSFGSKGYAKEELIAELGSVLLCYRLEIGTDMQNHSAYLQHWIEILQEDPKCLMSVLNAAKKAADLICPETLPVEA